MTPPRGFRRVPDLPRRYATDTSRQIPGDQIDYLTNERPQFLHASAGCDKHDYRQRKADQVLLIFNASIGRDERIEFVGCSQPQEIAVRSSGPAHLRNRANLER